MRSTPLLLAAALAMTPPAVGRADDGRRGLGEALWITGVSVFAASYVATGATATTLVVLAAARDATIAESWIPVVGPWIMLGDSAGFDSGQIALTAISAVLQTLSLASFVIGVVLASDGPPPVTVAPVAWSAGGGLSLGGVF